MLKMQKNALFRSAALIATLLLAAQSAHATLMISLSDGLGNTYSLADNGISNTTGLATGSGDMSAFAGSIVSLASVGAWSLNVTTGSSKPAQGSETQPNIHFGGNNMTFLGGAPSTLTVMITDTDFQGPLTDNYWIFAGGGANPVGDSRFSAYYDTTNTAFGTQTLISQTDPMSGGFSSTDIPYLGIGQAPYSLTIVAEISHTAWDPKSSGVHSSFDYYLKVSEPGTLLLIAAGLLGIGFGQRRTRTA